MTDQPTDTRTGFPLGAAVTIEQLEHDPHPVLATLRAHEPVSWLPALDGWLVTRHDLAAAVMRDATTYTVDDPRFSTRKVVGPSMLSLDGDAHAVHRAPFAPPFRPLAVRERFAEAARTEADRLIDSFGARREAELRREFAGPLAASIMARALGLEQTEVGTMLGWYDAIVAAVTEITAGHEPPARGREAFAALRDRLQAAIAADPDASLLAAAAAHAQLDTEQIVSNAAVLLFGGIETTEGMIANALLHLLERPDALATVRQDPGALDAAIEESLRLEPAAAVIDRYATAAADLANARHKRRRSGPDLDQRRQPRSGGVRRSRRARPRSQIPPRPSHVRPRPARMPRRSPGPPRGPRGARCPPAPAARAGARPEQAVPDPGAGVPQAPDAVRDLGLTPGARPRAA